MKLLRRIACLFVLFVFFMFGICVADRQRLNQNAVGICIASDSKDAADDISSYISGLHYENAEELCYLINGSGLGLAVEYGKQYFEAGMCDDGVVPAGVYDTVYIETNRNSDSTVYKTVLGGKILLSDKTLISRLQNGYVAILSLAGKLDHILLELQK